MTGASGTIGRAIAVALGREGAHVAVAYRSRQSAAEETAGKVREVGGQALTVPLDLAREASIEDAVHEVTSQLGPVDVLVNNAVAWPSFPQPDELFETAPVQRMRASLEANLLGPYILARKVVTAMRQRGWGRVVHVSSGLVEDGQAGGAAYVSAKAGLHGLARTMSRELASAGILTNVVMSGFVPGDRHVPDDVLGVVRRATATETPTCPEEVARAVWLVAHADQLAITAVILRRQDPEHRACRSGLARLPASRRAHE